MSAIGINASLGPLSVVATAVGGSTIQLAVGGLIIIGSILAIAKLVKEIKQSGPGESISINPDEFEQVTEANPS